MREESTEELTSGMPLKIIFKFAIPILICNLVQQLYIMADTIIVGHYLGVDAFAALGAVESLDLLIMGFGLGACGGFAIPMANRFGARDYRTMRRYFANSLFLGGFIALVIILAMFVFCRDILHIIHIPENIFLNSYDYIMAIFYGSPIYFAQNILMGTMRALGNSKMPSIFLMLSAVINVVLDIICIAEFNLGVSGVAYATVVSAAISVLLCILYITKKVKILHLCPQEWALDFILIKNLCFSGIPMGLEYSILSIGMVMIQVSINSLGSFAIAAVVVANRITVFLFAPLKALGSAMASYSGQNTGAGCLARLDQGLKSSVLLIASYALFAIVLIYSFGTEMIRFFMNGEMDVIDHAYLFLFTNVAFYFFLGVVQTFRSMIQGMGFSYVSSVSGLLEMITRVFISVVLIPLYGFTAICYANAISWVCASLFLVPMYFVYWRKLQNAPVVDTPQEME